MPHQQNVFDTRGNQYKLFSIPLTLTLACARFCGVIFKPLLSAVDDDPESLLSDERARFKGTGVGGDEGGLGQEDSNDLSGPLTPFELLRYLLGQVSELDGWVFFQVSRYCSHS